MIDIQHSDIARIERLGYNNDEIWKDVKDFEGYYQVSNKGRVRSLSREVFIQGNSKRSDYYMRVPEKMLTGTPNHAGYLTVHLRTPEKSLTLKIHRLVAIAFLGNPEGYPEVNHINFVRTDNRLENLEWCTSSYNSFHTIKVGRNFNRFTNKPRGITLHKATGLYHAKINVDNKLYSLGYHKEKSDAYKEYFEKFKELRGFEPWCLIEHPTH